MFVAAHFIINTPLKRGCSNVVEGPNRFSGFQQDVETVENGFASPSAQNTPLKQGVNEKNPLQNGLVCETFGLEWRVHGIRIGRSSLPVLQTNSTTRLGLCLSDAVFALPTLSLA